MLRLHLYAALLPQCWKCIVVYFFFFFFVHMRDANHGLLPEVGWRPLSYFRIHRGNQTVARVSGQGWGGPKVHDIFHLYTLLGLAKRVQHDRARGET